MRRLGLVGELFRDDLLDEPEQVAKLILAMPRAGGEQG